MLNRRVLYYCICCILFFGFFGEINAQELKKEEAFGASRILIGHSAVTTASGVLEITVQNRFWNTPEDQEGLNENTRTFIADRINSRFELAYGISDRLTVGMGYATKYKSFDGFLKYSILLQEEGNAKFPISMSLYQNGVLRSKTPGLGNVNTNSGGLTTQLLIAKKFTKNFSFQLSPSYVYGQIIDSFDNGVSKFLVGFGARYKLGNRVFLASEYYYYINAPSSQEIYGPFAIGVNWQVRKLMLQFCLTNVEKLVEDKILGATARNFNFRDGNLHFGFQATYLLNLSEKRF